MPGMKHWPLRPKKSSKAVMLTEPPHICINAMARNPVSVIDVTAIAEGTAVSKAALLNDRICLGAVHEASGQAPSPLVEVAGRTYIVPGVRHMTPARETADAARHVSGFVEIFNECLEARGEMPGYRYAVAAPRFYSDQRKRWMLFSNVRAWSVAMTVGKGPVNEKTTQDQ